MNDRLDRREMAFGRPGQEHFLKAPSMKKEGGESTMDGLVKSRFQTAGHRERIFLTKGGKHEKNLSFVFSKFRVFVMIFCFLGVLGVFARGIPFWFISLPPLFLQAPLVTPMGGFVP